MTSDSLQAKMARCSAIERTLLAPAPQYRNYAKSPPPASAMPPGEMELARSLGTHSESSSAAPNSSHAVIGTQATTLRWAASASRSPSVTSGRRYRPTAVGAWISRAGSRLYHWASVLAVWVDHFQARVRALMPRLPKSYGVAGEPTECGGDCNGKEAP